MRKILLAILILVSLFASAQNDYTQTVGDITTQNLNPLTGTPTAGSFVRLLLTNQSTATITVSGTYTGALSVQLSIDGGVTYQTFTNTLLLTSEVAGAKSATIASASIGSFTLDCSGLSEIRVSGLAAMTGTASVKIRAVTGGQQIGFSEQLPTGTNVIGALVANQSVNQVQFGGTNVVTGGVAGIPAVGGNIAHSTASTSNPVQSGGRIAPTTAATVDVTLVAGDIGYTPLTTGSQAVIKPFGSAELDFNNFITTAATVVTLQQIAPASGTANIRNYITGLQIQSDALGAAGNIWLLDGQGAIGTSVTIATPGVLTSTTHDLKVGDAIVFTSLATITGITTNTLYYVTATSFAATTFTVATTLGGTAIAITGSTAAFTFYRVLQQVRLQTSALTIPIGFEFINPLRGMANTATSVLIPTSLTSGNIYFSLIGYRGF